MPGLELPQVSARPGTAALGTAVPGQPGCQPPRGRDPASCRQRPPRSRPPEAEAGRWVNAAAVPAPSRRAGFARQGAKEKQLLKEGNAFNVSSFVLRAMMSGQYWPEGDEVYHAELAVPVLLVHGMHDKFVPVEEDQRMAEVQQRAGLGRGARAARQHVARQWGGSSQC